MIIDFLKQIAKWINISIVKCILTIVYFVVLLPYRLFMKKPESHWIEDEDYFDPNKMW